MSEHLAVLENAITDVGSWTWWTANLPESFQIEFGGTQLWNPPISESEPPSNLIALRFVKPRLVYFLTSSDALPADWPEQFQKDSLGPFRLGHDTFTLISSEECQRRIAEAKNIRAFVGTEERTFLTKEDESFIGFAAGDVGLVVAAESMVAVNFQGEVSPMAIIESNRKWWEYWREYWRRKETPHPMPKDYACEVTIPAGSEE